MRRVFIFAVIVLLAALFSAGAIAKPGGKNGGLHGDSTIGKQLWKFNVISIPSTSNWSADDESGPCNGARIFFEESTGTVTWKFDPSASKDFQIYDCDGTDSSASVIVDESIEAIVAVRLHGPKDSYLSLICSETADEDIDDNFCVLPDLNVNKTGKTNFHKILKTISDGYYEEYLLTLSGDWKIFEVRLFENLE